MFHHLKIVRQSYWEHFFYAMSYSFTAFKASVFFFIHAFIPDLFEFNGSKEIELLNSILVNKRREIFM